MNAQHTQPIQWYLDSFPWRVGDEYMYQHSWMVAMAMAAVPETAMATVPAAVMATVRWGHLWSYRLLVDGIRFAQ